MDPLTQMFETAMSDPEYKTGMDQGEQDTMRTMFQNPEFRRLFGDFAREMEEERKNGETNIEDQIKALTNLTEAQQTVEDLKAQETGHTGPMSGLQSMLAQGDKADGKGQAPQAIPPGMESVLPGATPKGDPASLAALAKHMAMGQRPQPGKRAPPKSVAHVRPVNQNTARKGAKANKKPVAGRKWVGKKATTAAAMLPQAAPSKDIAKGLAGNRPTVAKKTPAPKASVPPHRILHLDSIQMSDFLETRINTKGKPSTGLAVDIQLKGVESMEGVDVSVERKSVSGKDRDVLQVTAGSLYALSLPLPQLVESTTARAVLRRAAPLNGKAKANAMVSEVVPILRVTLQVQQGKDEKDAVQAFEERERARLDGLTDADEEEAEAELARARAKEEREKEEAEREKERRKKRVIAVQTEEEARRQRAAAARTPAVETEAEAEAEGEALPEPDLGSLVSQFTKDTPPPEAGEAPKPKALVSEQKPKKPKKAKKPRDAVLEIKREGKRSVWLTYPGLVSL
ncbi:PIH1 family protein [Kipferlia bialata]|uniref:PIH1 family protein n=1 Tax=Kipferlia bialata TaxID=797122 RepID=A0A9K3CMI5_9EUKA|nr:PIH1 family protein [Kipferlia bialata]|eukprot:g550.t1